MVRQRRSSAYYKSSLETVIQFGGAGGWVQISPLPITADLTLKRGKDMLLFSVPGSGNCATHQQASQQREMKDAE